MSRPKSPAGITPTRIGALLPSSETGNANTIAATANGRTTSATPVAAITRQFSGNDWVDRTNPARNRATPGAAELMSSKQAVLAWTLQASFVRSMLLERRRLCRMRLMRLPCKPRFIDDARHNPDHGIMPISA